jgi:hypothetical protein
MVGSVGQDFVRVILCAGAVPLHVLCQNIQSSASRKTYKELQRYVTYSEALMKPLKKNMS